MWQTYVITAQGTNHGDFQKLTEKQGQALQELGADNWELGGVTTLVNGWLCLVFKRYIPPELPEPPIPDSQYL